MSPSKRGGFTLVEVLIVSALVGVVAVTVFSSFSAGARLWGALQSTASNEDVNIFYLKFTDDLEGAFSYTGLPFQADPVQMTFTAFVDAGAELGGDRGIGRLSYEFDAGKHVLNRSVKNMSQVHKEKSVKPQPVLVNVRSMRFSYFVFKKEENTYEWIDEWNDPDNRVPMAVRVEFTTGGPGGGEFSRTVSLPGGSLEGAEIVAPA